MLAADCVYWPHLHAPLAATLRRLCVGAGAVALVAHVRRWKHDARFFELCRRPGRRRAALDVRVLHESVERAPDGRRVVTRLYRIAAPEPGARGAGREQG